MSNINAGAEADKLKSVCDGAIVKVDKTLGYLCLVLNAIPFTSGCGTMVSAFGGEKFSCMALLFGFLQWFLFWTVLGYMWSICFGVAIYIKSCK